MVILNQLNKILMSGAEVNSPSYGEKALKDITKVVENLQLLLSNIPGGDTVPHAIQSIKILRRNVHILYEENCALIKALECDNGHNAILRANKLMKKELK
jgi:hypothetical protein